MFCKQHVVAAFEPWVKASNIPLSRSILSRARCYSFTFSVLRILPSWCPTHKVLAGFTLWHLTVTFDNIELWLFCVLIKATFALIISWAKEVFGFLNIGLFLIIFLMKWWLRTKANVTLYTTFGF